MHSLLVVCEYRYRVVHFSASSFYIYELGMMKSLIKLAPVGIARNDLFVAYIY